MLENPQGTHIDECSSMWVQMDFSLPIVSGPVKENTFYHRLTLLRTEQSTSPERMLLESFRSQ